MLSPQVTWLENSYGRPHIKKEPEYQLEHSKDSGHLSSGNSLFASSKSGSNWNMKRKNFAKIFPRYLKPFPKYFIWKKKSKKIMAKRSLKAQNLDDQVPVSFEENSALSLSLAYSNSSKLFVEVNPELLEFSCIQIQAPTRSSKSFSHHPHFIQFKYFEFSLPNSEVKFLKGPPSKTPLIQSNKKCEPSFESPFSVSREKLEHLDRSIELESQKHFELLEIDSMSCSNVRKSQDPQIFLLLLVLVPGLAKY